MKTILRWIHDRLPCPNEPRPFKWEDYQVDWSYCSDCYSDLYEPGGGDWGDRYTIVTDKSECDGCNEELETV